MATITTINGGDQPANSRAVINTNFANLNSDKMETSVKSTDGTFASNSDDKIPSEKATKTYVDNKLTTIETTTGTTHSLTTVAGQKVIVWAKGTISQGATEAYDVDVLLNYNGVQKDKADIIGDPEGGAGNDSASFALMYTETPGAATQNITVTTTGGSLSNVVIIVMKIG